MALLAAALAFFLAENAVAAAWLRAHGGLRPGLVHAWTALRADGLVQLVLADAGAFTACALAWLWADLRRRAAGARARALWFAATLALGCPALLAYLAWRGAPEPARGAA